jgi:peroxiredoxin
VIVLYFYLGDFMPACSKEALAFQKDLGRLRSVGAESVGVSGDGIANHDLFKRTYRLKFPLLSDEKGVVCREFGVAWSGGGEFHWKDPEGKEVLIARGVTASRWLFVIGTDGKIMHKDCQVNPTDPLRTVWPVLLKSGNQSELP